MADIIDIDQASLEENAKALGTVADTIKNSDLNPDHTETTISANANLHASFENDQDCITLLNSAMHEMSTNLQTISKDLVGIDSTYTYDVLPG